MDYKPYQPRKEALEVAAADSGNRSASADCCQLSFVNIIEIRPWFLVQIGDDGPCNISALLQCNRSNTGQGTIGVMFETCLVTGHKNVLVPAHSQVRVNDHATLSIGLKAGFYAESGRFNTSCPQDGGRFNPLGFDLNTVAINMSTSTPADDLATTSSLQAEDIRRGLELYRQVADVVEGHAGWVAIAGNDAEMGVISEPSEIKSVYLLRLTKQRHFLMNNFRTQSDATTDKNAALKRE